MMNARIIKAIIFMALAGTVFAAPGKADEAGLRVSASKPNVDIKPRTNDRFAIRLPNLQYEFQVETDCPADKKPRSMLISIADTQKRLSEKFFLAGAETRVSVRVAANQIAPLTIAGFCLAADRSSQLKKESMSVRGALSAQVSLLCANENEEQITYASQALDVTLHCVGDKKANEVQDAELKNPG